MLKYFSLIGVHCEERIENGGWVIMGILNPFEVPSLSLTVIRYLLSSKSTGTQLSEESHRLVRLLPEF